ncbi:MAG: hydrolase [Clostridiales bacterium]|nr:hydrolase [Clostridiales bacterium]
MREENGLQKNYSKEFAGQFRSHMIRVPEIIRAVPGIRVFGKRIKSLVFSTDVAIIRNIDADAVLAVYPFTPQPVITQAILGAADVPVFCGIGGGITRGKRVVNLAMDAEFKGAMGVVVNTPTENETIARVAETVDIPIIVTVVSEYEDFQSRLDAGVSFFNVSGAAKTPQIVRRIKEQFPDIPVMATGGPNDESIRNTIEAGADAICYTPATNGEIFKQLMDKYRANIAHQAEEEEP